MPWSCLLMFANAASDFALSPITVAVAITAPPRPGDDDQYSGKGPRRRRRVTTSPTRDRNERAHTRPLRLPCCHDCASIETAPAGTTARINPPPRPTRPAAEGRLLAGDLDGADNLFAVLLLERDEDLVALVELVHQVLAGNAQLGPVLERECAGGGIELLDNAGELGGLDRGPEREHGQGGQSNRRPERKHVPSPRVFGER